MAKRKIDWLNHGLEFAVVFIGILIAFQLNQCSERKGQRALVKDHLEYLSLETTTNIESLQGSVGRIERNLLRLDTLERLIQSGEQVAKINDLSVKLLSIETAYLRQNAYSTLVETGDVRFVRDFSLKAAIFDMYEYYEFLDYLNRIAVSTYTENYFPYLQENFDLNSYQPQSLEVYRNLRFKNALGSYRYNMDQQIRVYNSCLERMQSFKTVLENQ